jgi:hypothetical protein
MPLDVLDCKRAPTLSLRPIPPSETPFFFLTLTVDKNGSIDADEYRNMFRRLYKCIAGENDLIEIDKLCAEVS